MIVIYYSYDLVNPIIKSVLLLVEWNIYIIIINQCISYLNHDFVTAAMLVGN